MRIKETPKERIFLALVYLVTLIALFVTLYPFVYVLSSSISDPGAVTRKEIWFFPKGFSLESYKLVLSYNNLWVSYGNTIWYTVVGSVINIAMTLITAYPLTRKSFSAGRAFTLFMMVTMFFSGGLIPSFLLVKNLGLYNTRWAIVLPAALSIWNVIITRTFLKTIPESIQESAMIDGANDIIILFRIVMPLSAPIIAVIGLFTAVEFWNSYFSAIIYLNDPKLYPMQLYLRDIVLLNSSAMQDSMSRSYERSALGSQVKFAVIIVAILPIVCVYPFLQKHFVKGVMIGSVKE